ncbi:hypothetical protein EDC96DRAFT_293484 [Choanephora cucurbitarum]|nr:hypothetical protein EDC96DRAFT_293484 [Choanephora cucurbitarum]
MKKEMYLDLDTEETEKLYARRMSTLRQLERGSSLHKKSHSTGSLMMLPPADAFIEPTTSLMDTHAAMENAALNATPATPGKLGSIEQWRVTVMEAEDMSQPISTASHSPVEDDESLVEEPIVRSLNSSSHLPAMRSQPSLVPNPRASTMDLEMMYYQQQQQMYNMQMQQAMQLQQAHQMAQIQQYQQAVQMQQQQMYAYNNSTSTNKSSHRKSVSAMDLMMQLEQEKAATRKNNKKKMPDPSKANLNEGLLSHVPKHGQHNINFQQQVRKMQHTMPRASISDYHLQQLQQQQQQKTRPSSSMNIYNMQHASQSSMLKMPRSGDMSPIPTISTSTPLNQQQAYFIPQQQPMLMPPQQMPMMDSNRSSQYNSKRQSTMNKF